MSMESSFHFSLRYPHSQRTLVAHDQMTMDQPKIGAGIIPFCVKDNQVLFLFHKTFTGRRAGHLVDFGGTTVGEENHRDTAIREFIEETETMYFSASVEEAPVTEHRTRQQIRLMQEWFDRTQGKHPDWWCERKPSKGKKRKDWKTFFVELNHKDLSEMNRAWRDDDGRRFTKRRELVWVAGHELLAICRDDPHKLWRRVRLLRKLKRAIGQSSKPRPRNWRSNNRRVFFSGKVWINWPSDQETDPRCTSNILSRLTAISLLR